MLKGYIEHLDNFGAKGQDKIPNLILTLLNKIVFFGLKLWQLLIAGIGLLITGVIVPLLYKGFAKHLGLE